MLFQQILKRAVPIRIITHKNVNEAQLPTERHAQMGGGGRRHYGLSYMDGLRHCSTSSTIGRPRKCCWRRFFRCDMVVTVFLFRWPISFFLSQPLISRLYAHRHHPLSALLRHLRGSHAHMQAITTLKGFNQEAMTTLRDIVFVRPPKPVNAGNFPASGGNKTFSASCLLWIAQETLSHEWRRI